MDEWQLAPGVDWYDDRSLAGGVRYRIVRLTTAEAAALRALLADGSVPPPGSTGARVAARLLRDGLLIPPLPPPVAPADVTVVVPAHSTSGSMQRLLTTITPDIPVVVVDDGSPDPLTGVAGRPNVTVVRHAHRRGAAAARNTGAGHADTRWIVFADVDIEPPAGWLNNLVAIAGEPDVVAVAPRIVNTPAPGLAGLVETYASALDGGVVPADVRPESVVSFVPTAALLINRAAFLDAGGFDESMKIGEDVDLVWRLSATGRIRYEPRIAVAHRSRTSLRQVLARRSFYAEGVGLLEDRHPGVFRYADVPVRFAVPWVLAVLVHPALGAAAAGLVLAGTRPDPARVPPGADLRLAVRGQLRAAASLSRWLVLPQLPVTAIALAVSPAPLRRRVGLAIAVGYLAVAARAAVVQRRNGASTLTTARAAAGTVTAHLLADLGQCGGVWRGCFAGRAFAPLWPRIRR